jgi:hypothetical protein
MFNWYLLSLVFESCGKVHEGDNLAIMQPVTNLSGKAHLRSSSSLATPYISWVCWSTGRFFVILKLWKLSMMYSSLPASAASNLVSSAS